MSIKGVLGMGEFDKTDFLTPQSSFLCGMGTAINLGGNFFGYNVSRSPKEADANAIFMDFQMVGNDMRQAMSRPAKTEDSPAAAAN